MEAAVSCVPVVRKRCNCRFCQRCDRTLVRDDVHDLCFYCAVAANEPICVRSFPCDLCRHLPASFWSRYMGRYYNSRLRLSDEERKKHYDVMIQAGKNIAPIITSQRAVTRTLDSSASSANKQLVRDLSPELDDPPASTNTEARPSGAKPRLKRSPQKRRAVDKAWHSSVSSRTLGNNPCAPRRCKSARVFNRALKRKSKACYDDVSDDAESYAGASPSGMYCQV